jgi:hypothetical protein
LRLFLIIFGLIGAFIPNAIDWLVRASRFIADLSLAWEIIVGVILVGGFLYYLMFVPDEESDEDSSAQDSPNSNSVGRGCLVILIIAWLAWIGISGYWRELLKPFTNLLQGFVI